MSWDNPKEEPTVWVLTKCSSEDLKGYEFLDSEHAESWLRQKYIKSDYTATEYKWKFHQCNCIFCNARGRLIPDKNKPTGRIMTKDGIQPHQG